MIGLELRSKVTSTGELQLSLEEVTIPEPGPEEVIVRVEASPLNPSDLGLLLGPADLSTMRAGGTAQRPTLTASISPSHMAAMASRLDQSMAVGNEAAGTVIMAGKSAQGLLGKPVGMWGGAMYAQYRKLPVRDCILLPEGATVVDGASMFVNPLTALAMIETMRREGHRALVHTAAASNLGQMLNRVCLAENIGLVNIVRNAAQADLLRSSGARYVTDSSSENFRQELTDAIADAGATLAFDAIGGGELANTILHAMEGAATRDVQSYSRYGSSTFKQVYFYGSLDPRPTEIDRGFGMAWGVGGFLLFSFLQSIPPEEVQKLHERVARDLKATFASHYSDTITLADVLKPEHVARFAKKATGEKYLIDPSR